MVWLALHYRRAHPVHPLWGVRRHDPGGVRLRLCLRVRRQDRYLQIVGRPGRRCHRVRCAAVPLCAEHSVPADPRGEPVISTAITDLWYGFGVALEPHNLFYCFLGVLVGNLVGVLPGMGPVATISILLPLTFGMQPVPAILMLSGVYYGAQYGGAICSILLNLPCHPPHAVTCLDGFPLTKQGKGGTALGITIIAAFIGASFGITEMIFLAPFLVQMALKFGPAEVCSLMLVGLLAGSTLAKGSPLKGIAMTVFGLLLGIVGTDIETGQPRFTFNIPELFDGIEIIALALGMFGIAELFPSKADLKLAFWPMIRGTVLGSLCALIPGTGPTFFFNDTATTEKKISKTPERFGRGAIEGV